jgi:hypothetical protein
MPDYDPSSPPSWQDCNFNYFFLMLAGISFLSGLASLALNPYFKRYVKKPIEREQAVCASDGSVTLGIHGDDTASVETGSISA